MSGFQFVHLQQYSKKALPGKTAKNGKISGARSSVAGVLAEANRHPADCLHVDNPLPPVIVFGLSPSDVLTLHDQKCEAARCILANGKERKIRSDQATILTVVASYSASSEEIASDPKKQKSLMEWQDRNLAWLQEQYGNQLISVIRHDDEKFPHLHAYVLPSDLEMRANALHAGWLAKQAAKENAEASGSHQKEANKIGDRAYKNAMRCLQDSYFEGVGIPSGLARLGPARRRITRADWKLEQAGVEYAATAIAASESATIQRNLTVSSLRVTAEKARVYVEAARLLADQAKAAADTQTAKAAAARAESEAAKRQAVAIIAKARREALQVVATAQAKAVKLTRLGERLGGLWSGFSAVQRRLNRTAAERVAKAEARATGAVDEAKAAVRSEFGADIERLKRDAERAVNEAEAARERERKALAEVGCERSARKTAEVEREKFRGLWADADNENIRLNKVFGN